MSIKPKPYYSKYALNRQAQRRRIRQRLLRENAKCFYCQVKLNNASATLDHIHPRSLGGTDHPTNLVLACRACNVAKGNKI